MAKQRILIVEDEAVTALDIEETLAQLGYDILGPVARGDAALEVAGKEHPALALMDIHLQGEMDGIVAAQELWSRFQVPSVFLTSHTDEATLGRAKLTNPYGYILKPYDADELRVTIELALHRIVQRREAVKQLSAMGVSPDQRPAASAPSRAPVEQRSDSRVQGLEQSEIQLGSKSLKPIDFIKRIDPLNQLSEQAIQELSAASEYRRLGQGEYIVFEHDQDSPAFVVASGRIAVMKTSSDGKDLNLGLLPPGDVYGLLLALDETPPTMTLKAQRDSVVLSIRKAALQTALHQKPELFKEFMQILLERIQTLNTLALSLAHERAEVRIASAIKMTMLDFGVFDRESNAYDVDLTRLELSELAGSTPETAIRITKSMERDGILDLTQASRIRILKEDALDKV